ncbi:ABC transporter substrate-binding protein [Anaerospora hongkongensis]|uniref:ABC transporter substrate-binding protein n=1 Tax=Anaerospora hongkongensis TaxID=244830 RepID=UPI0028A053C9|nr:ABC transporter substrate-binding protein [Anaerospora hongkongensis]
MKTIISSRVGPFLCFLALCTLSLAGCATPVQAPRETTAATRIVHTVMGDVAVPANPKRIVVNWYIGDVFTLGFKPAALAAWSQESMPFYDKFTGIPVIENWDTEAILAHDADLIITYSEEDFAKLSKIAPVIVVPEAAMPSVERLTFLGRATGREAEAETAIAAFEKKREEARNILTSDIFTNKTFSIFQDWGSGSYGIYYETESRAARCFISSLA